MRLWLQASAIAALVGGTVLHAQESGPAATEPTLPVMGANHETLITLQSKDATAKQVFAELAKQAGVLIQAQPETLWLTMAEPTSMDFVKRPFGEVMHDLCLTYGLAVTNFSPSNRHYILMKMRPDQVADANSRILFTVGPLLLSLNEIHHSRAIVFGDSNDVHEDFALSLSGSADPNSRIISYAPEIQVVEAIDDQGNSLLPPAIGVPAYPASEVGRRDLDFTCHLNYPSIHPGTKITRLKGFIHTIMQTRSEILTFTDLANTTEVTKSAGAFTVTFHKLDPSPPGTRSTLHISLAKTPTPEFYNYFLFNLAQTAITVTDTANRIYVNRGPSGVDNQKTADYTLTFDQEYARSNTGGTTPAPPGTLTVEIPIETKEILIPIELKDVKMP